MYKKICSDRQVSSNFLFVGFQRDLEKFYGAADFLIFPSAFEAFSLVLLEAAAAGLPILATKIDGTEELVEDGFNGIFFERTSDAIAAKLALVYENRGLLELMSKNALTRTNVYTRENMVNEYRMFYNKIIAAEQVTHSS
jgi:UDP-glucose:(heptosyl)LPS alpha-1,3-glucosyltransferase